MVEFVHEIPRREIESWLISGAGYGARPRRSGMGDVLAYVIREGLPVLIHTVRVESVGERVFVRGERGGVFDHSDMD